jgi:hypothetical protein
MGEFLEKNAGRGWKRLEDFRGLRRDRVVGHSQIRRPEDSDYHGGYEVLRRLRRARGAGRGASSALLTP